MMSKQIWVYGVVGNIVREHYEGNLLRYGTAAFRGGTKVWLCGKGWDTDRESITVIGVNRFGRYAVNDVPPEFIENARCQKVFRPAVLRLMGDWEFHWYWWNNTKKDRQDAEQFAAAWNERLKPGGR